MEPGCHVEAAAQASGLRLVSWNVNGIRALGKRLLPALQQLQAQIICLQETRVTRDLLDEPTAIIEGFNSYFSFCRGRSGYSGVATYCTDDAVPFAAEEGLSGLLANQSGAPAPCMGEGFSDEELRWLDAEGRALITKHCIRRCEETETLTVINVYCPRADPQREERSLYKLRFYRLLQARAQALLQDGGHVIVLGDMNTAHRPIDHCQPGDLDVFVKQPDRVWMNGFLSCSSDPSQADGIPHDGEAGLGASGSRGDGPFVDLFRHLHPAEREAYTCWRTSTGARKTNYGTRIDYILADKSLAAGEVQDCVLMPQIEGSDHCPVKAFLKARCVPAAKCPPLCTKYMPEFAGLQQKLSQFLVNLQGKPNSPAEIEQTSQSQEGPPAMPVKAGQKRTGKCLTGGPGKRSRGDSRPAGSLLRFFKPAERDPDSGQETAGELGIFHQSLPTLTGHQSPHTQEVKQDKLGEGQQSPLPAAFWRSVLKGPPRPPACPGHREPCLLRTVRKPGPNHGRQFYVCPRPEGAASNPGSRCDFFLWVSSSK